MAKFYLTKKSVHDLTEIWDYTVENWSESQAEIYYKLLVDSFQSLAKLPNKGKSYDFVTKDVLGNRIGQHIVFYKIIATNEIEIIRVLHVKMDLKSKF